MENSSDLQDQKYIKLYTNSKQYAPYKLLEKLGIKDVNKKTLTNFLITSLFCITTFLTTFFLSYSLKNYSDKSPFYIVYIVLIAAATRIGGIKPGLLMTIVFSLESQFVFNANNNLLQLLSFFSGAVIIALLISGVRRNYEKERLKKQQDIYAKKFIVLYDSYKKAIKEIKARDEFLSVVSHELRTPLTTMLLTLHNMLNNIRNVSLANFSVPELIKVLKNSENQIKRLKIIINDLLDISLITTGRMQLSPKKTDLVAITRRVTESFSELLKNRKDQIEIEATHPVFGNFDKTRLEQAITNLISNAIKYGEGKPIRIQIFNSKNTAHFIITDQGVGIPAKDQEQVFGLFKRANWSKEYTNGLGVGLYIAAQIIKAHGGEIKISSKPLKGSTFSIKMPLN